MMSFLHPTRCGSCRQHEMINRLTQENHDLVNRLDFETVRRMVAEAALDRLRLLHLSVCPSKIKDHRRCAEVIEINKALGEN